MDALVDALTPLAWWGSRTEKVRLGTSLCQLSARTPTAMAMAAQTMDYLSNQRFVLGVKSMKVRRSMIQSKHLNHNAIENADRRHKDSNQRDFFKNIYINMYIFLYICIWMCGVRFTGTDTRTLKAKLQETAAAVGDSQAQWAYIHI